MLRFLPGVLLIQAITAALVFALLRSDSVELRWVFGGLVGLFSLVAALWFGSIAAHRSRDAVSRVEERFARDREKMKLSAEKAKSQAMLKVHKDAAREVKRAQGKANTMVMAAFAGTIGLGVLMVFSNLLTLGVVTLSASGGALGGYLLRLRQEGRGRAAERLVGSSQPPAGLLPKSLDRLKGGAGK